MYKIIMAILIFTDFFISACGRFNLHKYEIGKSFSFENKGAFISYAEKQTSFQANNIYYASESGYANLVYELKNNTREGNLWGFYTGNQPYHLLDSSELKNLYCKNRIQNLVSDFFVNGKIPGPYLTDSVMIKSFQLKKLSNDDDLKWSDYSDKKLIVLQFATAYGSYYKDLFAKIASSKLKSGNSGKIIILCLDPVFQLP